MRNPTRTKTWQKIVSHPRVASARDEGADGFWAELRDGWSFEGTHSVHRNTLTALLLDINAASPCSCDDCGEETNS